jgi:hypothetical protein
MAIKYKNEIIVSNARALQNIDHVDAKTAATFNAVIAAEAVAADDVLTISVLTDEENPVAWEGAFVGA